MERYWLRVRRALSDQYAVAVLVLALFVALGGWVTYTTHVEPGSHVENRETATWQTTADFSHAATVTEENPVYAVDTTLKNRTVYFGSIAPVLNGTFEYGYTASEGGNVSVSFDTWLVFRDVERTRNEVGTVYWRKTRGLGQRHVATVAPGDSVRIPFSLNVSSLANTSRRIEEELGRTRGETEALVHTSVSLNGTVNGEPVSRSNQFTLPIAVDRVYRVRAPSVPTEEFTSTRSVTVENTYGPLRRVGGPLVVTLSSLALVGLVGARWLDALEPSLEEQEYLVFRRDRSEFDEWINRIALPDSAAGLPRGRAASLADLVDFAIDTDNSVIEDPADGSYHVIHDGYHYTYEPPSPPARGLLTEGVTQTETTDESDQSEDDGEHDGSDPLSADST